MNKQTCLIYNYAQHYRGGIFKLLDRQLNIDSYFGDKMGDVKKLDYKELKNFKKELKNINIYSHIYWQKGALKLLFKPYANYIILGEYYCLSTWFILIFSKFSNKKIYLWTHGWYGNESASKRILKKAFFKLSDSLLLYGNYAKELMIDEGFKKEKLHVIYNSLDYKKQLEVRSKLKKTSIYNDYFGNDNPVLIFIGRLTKIKNLNFLIEIQKKMVTKETPINLIFIGSGEEEENLKRSVKLNNTEKLTWFFGPSYDEYDIGNLLYNADICVSPGNVGLTAMHAMTYGTPVISHNNFSLQMPEFESIVKGVTGEFFEYNNKESLLKTIENWLNNNHNREFTRKSCFERIDKYFNPAYQIEIIKNQLDED
ncbi:glycosyltransferase [Polaribacter sp. WD7]|uniref:glycosyltransferase n=1 Tax=Polaribacter sp. WD7 TaxID=2269061 RepID=UPI000DF1313B|nr:glycosyltransferase [Polaribacter sp. WD7]RCS27695.1 glycosyltransferase [Polaribacter sp. WD7]